jgi:hypothetical protein
MYGSQDELVPLDLDIEIRGLEAGRLRPDGHRAVVLADVQAPGLAGAASHRLIGFGQPWKY